MANTTMTRAEREAFLAGLHVGVLSIPSDGAPLSAPIWYDYEPGGDIWVLTGPESKKGRLSEAVASTALSVRVRERGVPLSRSPRIWILAGAELTGRISSAGDIRRAVIKYESVAGNTVRSIDIEIQQVRRGQIQIVGPGLIEGVGHVPIQAQTG